MDRKRDREEEKEEREREREKVGGERERGRKERKRVSFVIRVANSSEHTEDLPRYFVSLRLDNYTGSLFLTSRVRHENELTNLFFDSRRKTCHESSIVDSITEQIGWTSFLAAHDPFEVSIPFVLGKWSLIMEYNAFLDYDSQWNRIGVLFVELRKVILNVSTH